ncbi:error-prone DNA polymerase [soil metagenome]
MPESPLPKFRSPPPSPETAGVAPSTHAYAELEAMTNFSFLEGASHPDELVYRAAQLGYRAIAVTDLNTLAGVIRAHQAAKKSGLKLLIGSRLRFIDAPDVLVWATNRAAYGRLCRLLTLGRRRADKGECILTLKDFIEHSEGMFAAIIPSGDHAATEVADSFSDSTNPPRLPSSCGLIPEEARAHPLDFPPALADRGRHALAPLLQTLKQSLGPRLSIAFSHAYDGTDQRRWRTLLELSHAHRVPLLATNNVLYHDASRRTLQDVLTCIRHGCPLEEAGFKLMPNGERYLKPPEQMHHLFADHPQAIRRGLEIAEQCTFSLDELKYEYPDELVPAGQSPIKHLADLTWAGAADRYPAGVPEKVHRAIVHELALIEQMKFEAYFLTVHDLVRFARSKDILCQGRGSAANSAVCYCLGVTSVNPDQIDLLFERFISGARGEPPDIDVDFEHERREEVIQYIYDKYGRERAGMTATLISYRGRSAVRDVGKALGLGLDVVEQVAKRLDWWDSGKLTDEDLRAAGLNPQDHTIRLLVDRTREILGFPRHLSQHVGGMVMTRGPLCELVPIENASMADRTVIQWDKDDLDAIGILKVDILALGMLTCIAKCLRMLNARAEFPIANFQLPIGDNINRQLNIDNRQSPFQLHTIPREDPTVYEMISDADTVGVFQIESRAQMSMLPRLKPKEFYDLVIEVAIVRPGPIVGDMVHPYLRRRNGEEPVDYPSEALKSVLGKTLGVPLFQEQAMKVVMVAAGFSADEADQLRRAMAAWRYDGHIEQFHDKIMRGMAANGYTQDFSERLFEQIRGFSGYGFPESHSASFALLVYASAWIKRHHPAVFCCGLLNSLPMGFYAPAQLARDAREHGVNVLPVDVNFSEWESTLEELTIGNCRLPNKDNRKSTWGDGGPAVRLGFGRIKGMREPDALRIVEARKAHGPFTSVEQFHRVTHLSAETIRRLADADAFGSVPNNRRTALWNTLAIKDAQLPLFEDPPLEQPVSLPKMPLGQEVMADYSTISLSLKRHPVALLRSSLKRRGIITAAELLPLQRGWVKVAGLVLIRQRPGTANGIVFVTLEDETGVVNLIIRPHLYEKYRAAARHAHLLQADGPIERQGKVIHIMAKQMHDLSPMLSGHEFRSRDFR